MAAKKVGALIKEARTAAGLTQEKLAKAAGEGLTASDIGKCERGSVDLTASQLKKIAVACGVTQTSLVNAPKNLPASAAKKATASKTTAAKTPAAKAATAKANAAKSTASKTTAAKTAASKTTAAKTTTTKTAAAKKTGTAQKTGAAAKASTPAAAGISMKVTASEKKLVEAYRSANGDMKKVALKVLKGEYGDKITGLLNVVGGGSVSGSAADSISDTIGNLLSGLLGGK